MKRIIHIVAGLLLFAASVSAGNNVPKYVGVTSTGVPFASLFDSTKVPQADGTIMTVTGVDGSATTCAAGSVTRIAQRIDGAWICNPAGGSGAAIPDPLRVNAHVGTGVNPTISGFHGSLAGALDPTSNLNLKCTAAAMPYAFCTGYQAGTFTPAACDGATDDQTAIQATLTAAAAGSIRSKVIFPAGVQCNFSAVLDFMEAPVECANRGYDLNEPSTVLKYTGTSGYAIQDAGYFKNCNVISATNTIASVVTGTISAISESGTTASVVLSAPPSNPIVAGNGIMISATTNYNGVWKVNTAADSTHFTFQMGGVGGIASEASGTIKFYPTVGVAANGPNHVAAAVDWDGLVVDGFGVALDLSGNTSGTGSIDDWKFGKNTVRSHTLIGVLAMGNGLAATPANVAAGKIVGPMQIVGSVVGIKCGPRGTPGEQGCSRNDFAGLDIEGSTTSITSGESATSVVLDGPSNHLHNGYISGGSVSPSLYLLDTSAADGGNEVSNMHLAGGNSAGIQWKQSALMTDYGHNNDSGRVTNQMPAPVMQGSVQVNKTGTAQAPYITAGGTNLGTGANIYCYGLRGYDQAGFRGLVSTFACSSDKPNFGAGDKETICWFPDDRFIKYDIINCTTASGTCSDTGHDRTTAFIAGSNDNNCFSDATGALNVYTYDAIDHTGNVNTVNGYQVNALTAIGAGTAGIAGGGSLATGSQAYAGTVTGSAATGNVLTPGFTCPNKVVCLLSDETTGGGAKITASDTTTCTFSATANDVVDYWTSCR